MEREATMPDIQVEVRGSWLDDKRTAFLEAVHRAVVHALATPPDEPLARLIEHQATDYLVPESAGDRFTRIEIVLFVGRSLEAKRELYRAVVRNLEPFGVPPADVKVVLIEVSSENVGFRGGQAASDVDLGYGLQV
jgi:phenylpyruvate tautomerase PptA (4-oxalocrotonate tautomerase family)